MLEALFGNKNIERILIFLFVNTKCYGTQLHRQLKIPLTPIQKALLRLERGGIIDSYCEGKTRLFRFNPTFPLLPELEALLKRTYTLLPSVEKKLYYLSAEDSLLKMSDRATQAQLLQAMWSSLSGVKQLAFEAKSKSHEANGWNGKGKGEVAVAKESSKVLIFNEKGNWRGKEGQEIGFSNVFRWTFDREAGLISLEHLRRGPENPVFLFHLAPSGTRSLSSVDSHLCEGDAYFGQVFFDRHGLRLNWRVIGPKKNEEINYYYS